MSVRFHDGLSFNSNLALSTSLEFDKSYPGSMVIYCKYRNILWMLCILICFCFDVKHDKMSDRVFENRG